MATKKPEYIKQREDGSVDITLNRPLDVSGTKMSVITMREPTVGDQLAASEGNKSDAEQELSFICNLCMLAPDDLKKMPLRDYRRVQETFLGFLV